VASDSDKPAAASKTTVIDKCPTDPFADLATETLLIVMTGNDVGRIFNLQPSAAPTIIGREDGSSIQIMDGEISRRHASLRYDASDDSFWLSDLDSRNGTTVNGSACEGEVRLAAGDKIGLGSQTVLRVSHSEEPESHYARKMYQAVLRDGMTGAYNRRYLDERLTSELAFANRHGQPLSLLLIDLDHFKRINDNHGHQAGDAVLRQLVQLLHRHVRREDVLFRYGGEEFVVLCRQTSNAEATVLAERLRQIVERHQLSHENVVIPVTISIGVATTALDHSTSNDGSAGDAPTDATTIDDASDSASFDKGAAETAATDSGTPSVASLFDMADRALYEAKSSGRNTVRSG